MSENLRWDVPSRSASHASLTWLLERACTSFPNALAVRSKERSVTYRELWQEASRVGSQLQAAGVRAGDVVGICLPRSVEAVITMVGVLRCGAAYLPVEPTSPTRYSTAALSAAGARTIATNGQLASRFQDSPFRSVDIDTATADAFVAAKGNASDLMYILFTSGSTGAPKGVAIEHRSVVNLVRWHVAAFGSAHGSRMAQGSRLVFDASVWEIWPPLVSGGSVHIVPESLRAFPKALQRWYADNVIDFAFLVSPLAEEIMELHWDKPCPLRVLFTGGERLHSRPPASFPATLVNAYGPTETTVVATAGVVATRGTGDLPSIGRPITGVQVYVIDDEGKRCPPEIDGEICIGGCGVARGYINDPELRARQFVPDPFSPEPTARMYRTGDLGHLDAHGELHFAGRRDGQVKVRGQRVDIAQLEAALSRHPAVRSCAVVVVGEGARSGIHAVIVPRAAPELSEIKRDLAACFPDYLLPDSYRAVSNMPLTANGKIDRGALAEVVWGKDR